ncbi:hypothetical protein BDW59DRAFT_159024 [Aspergillus cavernicola]|uniref:Ubiquitin-like protease family profile domain-containing protein n=1 Tax=Aspergillus cavernicola TaxID=176166 RepID=A0ABR4INT8_9EURO
MSFELSIVVTNDPSHWIIVLDPNDHNIMTLVHVYSTPDGYSSKIKEEHVDILMKAAEWKEEHEICVLPSEAKNDVLQSAIEAISQDEWRWLTSFLDHLELWKAIDMGELKDLERLIEIGPHEPTGQLEEDLIEFDV